MPLHDKLRDPRYAPKSFSTRPELLRERNVPKPMHQVAPRVVLGQEWWDRERREAYRSTAYRCAACGVEARDAAEDRPLEAHEVYRVDYAAGRMVYVEAVPLCHYCHNFIHCGRLLIFLQKGWVTLAKYDAIMRHGRRVLRTAGLRPQGKLNVQMARWEDWRLVVYGKEYPPLFKSYSEWIAHFNPPSGIDNEDPDFYDRLGNQDGD